MVSYVSAGANVVLFVTACFLAASTANNIFAAMLTPPEPEALEHADAYVPKMTTWAEREVILDRNLFGASVDAQSLASIDPLADIEETQLPLDLLGTAAADDPALSWAAVMDRETRKTLVVSVGDDLKGKATVARIERRRVVLQENGAPRELTFGDDETLPTTIAARRPAPTPARPVRLPRGQVESALANPGNILSQARFQPKTDQGELVGIEVNAIKSGSVLEEVGLQNGDLIVEFNGIAIDSPEQSGRLLQEFNDARELSLLVEAPDGTTRSIPISLD